MKISSTSRLSPSTIGEDVSFTTVEFNQKMKIPLSKNQFTPQIESIDI